MRKNKGVDGYLKGNLQVKPFVSPGVLVSNATYLACFKSLDF